MELFKLFATLAIRNKEANDALDETSDKAEGAKGKFANAFEKMGTAAVKFGKVVATGVVAGAGAVAAITKQAVEAYADYEQLVGGVETLFGKSADIVMNYANNAYKTAGMSANEYMETVTGFSASLLQSLDNDTEKAAQKADVAISDMSDNANKMGSSMESIQNAYQGFAKQNYTMLDNLKLGYGGTKEEMQRLLADAEKLSGQKFDLSSYADIVDAIHIVQTEMGITGTTAKEAATTIQGSISSFKASWQNLLVGMADDSQDFDALLNNVIDNGITVIENILPKIQVVFNSIPKLINGVIPQIPVILQGILPALLEAATQLLTGLVAALPSIVNILMDIIPTLIDAVLLIGNELVKALPLIIDAIFQFFENPSNISALLNAAIDLFMTLVNAIPEIVSLITEQAPAIIDGLISGIMGAVPNLLSSIGDIFTALWDTFVIAFSPLANWFNDSVIQPIINFFQGLWENIKSVFSTMFDYIDSYVFEPIRNGWYNFCQDVISIWDNIKNAISFAFQLIANIISAAFQIITLPFRFIWENCKEYVFAVFDAIREFINNAINKIKEIITTVLNAIKAVWNTVWTAVKDFLMPIINSIKDFISTAFNAIKNIISTVVNTVKTVISTVFNAIRDVITNIINSVKNTVTNVFNAIKNAISVPLNAAKSTVSNVFDAIRDKIDSVISKAKDIVQKGLGAIKGFFDKLKLKFPDLKLPHFKVDGEFSVNPPKVPKFAIDWYDKAMDDGMIMNEPTIFGVNSKGQFMAGGETGSETIVGTQSLMNMVNNAVGQSNNGLYDVLDKILAVLKNIDNSMYDRIVAALQAMGIEFDERELARLVKKYA